MLLQSGLFISATERLFERPPSIGNWNSLYYGATNNTDPRLISRALGAYQCQRERYGLTLFSRNKLRLHDDRATLTPASLSVETHQMMRL